MFRWLYNKYRNWATERRRKIFAFYNGKKWANADPYVVWLNLKEDPEFDFEVDIPAIDRGDIESTQKMVNAVHRAFGTSPLSDDSGITVDECRALLARFLVYVGSLKKNAVATQTSTPDSDGKGSEDQSITNDGSESSSTTNESPSDNTAV